MRTSNSELEETYCLPGGVIEAITLDTSPRRIVEVIANVRDDALKEHGITPPRFVPSEPYRPPMSQVGAPVLRDFFGDDMESYPVICVSHRAYWWEASRYKDQSYDEEIIVSRTSTGGGCKWEFMIRWYNIGGALAMKIELFDEAFEALADIPEFFAILPELGNASSDEVADLFTTAGFADETGGRIDHFQKYWWEIT